MISNSSSGRGAWGGAHRDTEHELVARDALVNVPVRRVGGVDGRAKQVCLVIGDLVPGAGWCRVH